MAVIHEEIDAVLFWRNRVRVRFRHALHDFGVLDVEFEAARGARLSADLAPHHQGRLLRQILQRLEDVFRQGAFHRDALHHASAVANLRKTDFAATAKIVQPARQLDGFAAIAGGVLDPDTQRHAFRTHFRYSGFPGDRTLRTHSEWDASHQGRSATPAAAGIDPARSGACAWRAPNPSSLPRRGMGTDADLPFHYCHGRAWSEFAAQACGRRFPRLRSYGHVPGR